jgi:hypothetical protein
MRLSQRLRTFRAPRSIGLVAFNGDAMERVISLFREADYEQWSVSESLLASPEVQDEPLYFQQILEYLRESKHEQAQERGGASW